MKLLLLKDARIKHHAGDVVEVTSPDEAHFLLSLGVAEVQKVGTETEAPKKITRKKKD